MKKKILVIISICLFVFVSCVEGEKLTPAPYAVNTFALSLGPTKVPDTITPTSTHVPSTPTQLSTLIPENAKIELFSLANNNGNCLLPCVWGITPGMTSLEEAKSSIARFGEFRDPEIFITELSFFNGEGHRDFTFWEQNWKNSVYFTYYGKAKVELLSLEAEGPKIQSLPKPSPLQKLLSYYTLPQILINYGKPSETLIYVFPTELAGPYLDTWDAYDLVLFYPEKGFFINYILTKEKMGNNYVGCPQRINDLSLITWPFELDKSLVDVAKENLAAYGMRESNINSFLSIEDATSISPDAFYEKYKVPNEEDCIETPAELWPDPQPITSTPP